MCRDLRLLGAALSLAAGILPLEAVQPQVLLALMLGWDETLETQHSRQVQHTLGQASDTQVLVCTAGTPETGLTQPVGGGLRQGHGEQWGIAIATSVPFPPQQYS